MPEILFTLRDGLTEQAASTVIERVKTLPGVEHAGPLKADASREVLRRFCYARVADPDASRRVLDALRGMPEIQDAELPPRRGLL